MGVTTAIAAVRTQRETTLHDPLALWHLLSLDAPTVAVVWTVFLAYYFDVALPWNAPAALALAVWLVYAADRLQDARSAAETLEERHHFHARHARAFGVAMAFAAIALVALLLLLPRDLRTGWMLLGVPMMGYVAGVHVLQRRVPKEALVGVFFGAATVMPVLLAERSFVAVLAGGLFGALCWLNCVFIARNEGAAARGAVTRWAVRHFSVAASLLVLSALVVFVVSGDGALAVALGAALLLVLDAVLTRGTHGTPPELFGAGTRYKASLLWRVRVRALADAALLTPLLVLPLLRWLR